MAETALVVRSVQMQAPGPTRSRLDQHRHNSDCANEVIIVAVIHIGPHHWKTGGF